MYWNELLKENVTSAKELRELIQFSPEEEAKLEQILERFPMRIPRYYLNLIDR